MEVNLTAFLLGLPDNYDSMDPSARLSYLNESLPAFTNATTEVQQYLADQDVDWYTQDNVLYTNNTDALWIQADFYRTSTMPPEVVELDINCTDTVLMVKWEYLLGSLLVAGLILVCLSFIKTRKRLCKNFLWGRPAVVYPVDFITDNERRWAYTAAFTLLAYRTLKLFTSQKYLKIDLGDYRFLDVFEKILNVLAVGLSFSPFLSCIGLRRYIVANILGLIFLIPWILDAVMSALELDTVCLNPHGDKFFEGINELLADIPQYITIVILFVSYIWDLVVNLKQCIKRKEKVDSMDKPVRKIPHEEKFNYEYVAALLKRKPITVPQKFIGKVKQRVTYKPIPGYKFTSRISCTMVCAAFFVFYLAINAIAKTEYYLGMITALLENGEMFGIVVDAYSFITSKKFTDQQDIVDKGRQIVTLFRVGVILGLILSALVQVYFMVQTTVNYRNHLAKLRRGVHTFHYKKFLKKSPTSLLLSQLRYSGYQIAFMAWGFSILAAIIIILILVLGLFIILPLMDRSSSALLNFLKDHWPNFAVAIVIYISQIILVKFAFLQERGKYLALNNRRVYHVVSYYLFIFNVILGIFSCLKRLVFSVVFGTLIITRLDRPLLMKGFEFRDSGYSAYLGLLYVDHTHNNPIMRTFVHSLWSAQQEAKAKPTNLNLKKMENGGPPAAKSKIKKHVRNKWWKFVTLINNPSLVMDEMSKRVRAQGTRGLAADLIRSDEPDNMNSADSKIINTAIL